MPYRRHGKVYTEMNGKQKERPCMRCKKVKVKGHGLCTTCRKKVRSITDVYSAY